MPVINSHLVQVMRTALDEVMARVPPECRTPATKAHLAEFILKAAAQGQTGYDQLVDVAVNQIKYVITSVG